LEQESGDQERGDQDRREPERAHSPGGRPGGQRGGGGRHRMRSIFSTSFSLGTNPRSWSRTFPPLKNRTVGTDMMPYFTAVAWARSMSRWATFRRLAYSPAIASTTGASLLHGAHHSAEKSRSTGREDCRTSFSKLVSSTSTVPFMGSTSLADGSLARS